MMLKSLNNLPSWLRLTLTFPLFFLNGFLLALLLNYLQPLVSFVIIAAILAFLLELAVQLLQQRGMKRGWAIATVLLLTLVTVVIVGAILIPLITMQLGQLIENAPGWIRETTKQLKNLSQLPIFSKLSIDLNSLVAKLTEGLSKTLETLGTQTLNILVGTISSALNTLLILILTIFLLIGGDTFWEGIFSWLPSPWGNRVQDYLQQTFKDYFFSRLILATISSVARLIIFIPLGVPYAVLFAFGIGIGGFVPFVSGIITLLGTIILCFNSVVLGLKFFVAAFIIDQITDNVIAPRLMGEAIGLNPIWLIISLFIGAKMGGILGLFLAVPLASVIKQLFNDLRSESSSVTVANNSETTEDIS